MSMYAVKNDNGEWLGWEVYQDYPEFICGGGSVWTDLDKAKFYADMNGGYVIELIEAPAKVVVNEKEAEMLEQAKCDDDPAELIVGFVNSRDNYDDDRKAEDRLMRAYVNGWEVEKPKRWNIKVPHTEKTLYRKHDSGVLFASIYVGPQNRANDFLFTAAEIEHYGLQDCEKAEVKQDEN